MKNWSTKMRRVRNVSVVAFVLFWVGTWTVHAHVKWFTEEEAVRAPIDDIINPAFIVVALLSAILLGVLPQWSPRMMKMAPIRKLNHVLSRWQTYTHFILRIGVSVGLLLHLLLDSVLAPEMTPSDWSFYLAFGTAVLILIPHSWAIKTGGIGIIILYAEMVHQFGWFHALDYVFYVAIGFALFVQRTRYEELGTPALYLFTGFSLCWVAAEKWVYPVMSADIITSHHVPTFGFSAEMFIMLAAFIEFVVGYLLIVGILNRFLSLILTGIFIMTTTLFGMLEVVGHFIIHIILVIFIIRGTGFYEPPVSMHKRTIDQIIFIVLNFLFVLASVLLLYYRFA